MTDIGSYQAAVKNTAYFHQPQAGFLRVGDRDRVDFLQRQTTNDLRQLQADRSISTVLTSPTARILDLFHVIDEGETLGVVSLPGRFRETSNFLRGRIFFSDQVRLDDVSEEVAQILFFGPQVDGFLKKLGLQPPAQDHFIRCEIANLPITVVGQKILADVGFRFLASVESFDPLMKTLGKAGAFSLDSETFEILRVEAGQPGPVSELVDTYTPLEIGLHKIISDSKGCYTGQEIIARQITYDKVAKNLVGVKLNDLVEVGAEIKVASKLAGTLTSAVISPRFGPIGLGVVRRQYRQAGTGLSVVAADGSVTTGALVALPFQ